MIGDLKIGELWFSFDHIDKLSAVKKVANLLSYIPREKKYIFVLIGFNGEKPAEAEARLKMAYEMGFMPFAQYYRDMQESLTIPYEWRGLVRTWSRPAAIKALMKGKP